MGRGQTSAAIAKDKLQIAKKKKKDKRDIPTKKIRVKKLWIQS